jgi:hypothetical protein
MIGRMAGGKAPRAKRLYGNFIGADEWNELLRHAG